MVAPAGAAGVSGGSWAKYRCTSGWVARTRRRWRRIGTLECAMRECMHMQMNIQCLQYYDRSEDPQCYRVYGYLRRHGLTRTRKRGVHTPLASSHRLSVAVADVRVRSRVLALINPIKAMSSSALATPTQRALPSAVSPPAWSRTRH